MKSINRILSIVLSIIILAGSFVAPDSVFANDHPTSYGEWTDISEFPDLVMGTDTNVFTIAGDGTTMFMWTGTKTALAADILNFATDTTITVSNTDGFPSAGKLKIANSGVLTYTEKTNTTFTGDAGWVGAVYPAGSIVVPTANAALPATTTAGANPPNNMIGSTTLKVTSTAGFPATGQLLINSSSIPFEIVTYSAITSTTTFTISPLTIKHYAGRSVDLIYSGSALYKSTDAGITWSAANLKAPATSAGMSVTMLRVCPTNSQQLIASDGTKLYRSIDGGQNWAAGITAAILAANATVIRSIDLAEGPNGVVIIAGTDQGVSLFDPATNTWCSSANGNVYAVALAPNFIENEQALAVIDVGNDIQLHTKVGANAWNTNVAIATLLKSNTTPIAAITTAGMAFPSDYSWDSNNQVFIGINDNGGGDGDVYRVNRAPAEGTLGVRDCALNSDIVSLAVSGTKSDSTVIASAVGSGINISADADADTETDPNWLKAGSDPDFLSGVKNPYYSTTGNPPVLQIASTGVLYAGVSGTNTSFYRATPDFKSFNGISRTEVSNIYYCNYQTYGYLFDYYLASNSRKTMYFYKTAEGNLEMRLAANDSVAPGFTIRPSGIWQSKTKYAVLNKNKKVVYKSTDAGLTWNQDRTYSQDITALGVMSDNEYYIGSLGYIQSNLEDQPKPLNVNQAPTLIAPAGTEGVLVGCNNNNYRVPRTWLYSSDGNNFSTLGIQDQWDDTARGYNYLSREEMLQRDGDNISAEAIYVLKSNGFLYKWVLPSTEGEGSTEWAELPLTGISPADFMSLDYVDVVSGVTFISLKKTEGNQLYRALPKQNGKLKFRPYLGTANADIGGQLSQFGIWKNDDQSFRFQAYLSDFPKPYPPGGTANSTKLFTFTDFYGPLDLLTADDAEFNQDDSLDWSASKYSIPVQYRYQVSTSEDFESMVFEDYISETSISLSEVNKPVDNQLRAANMTEVTNNYNLETGETYYWRVCVDDPDAAYLDSLWSETRSFEVVACPTITDISPFSGPTIGGTTITITGTGFVTGNTTVTIGGAFATDIVVVRETSITAVTPAGTAGVQDVIVTTPGGLATLVGGFTYSDWFSTGSMSIARSVHTATLLPNGKVLVAGGFNGVGLSSCELYDPTTGAWSITGSMNTARLAANATLLPNGNVLVVGGSSAAGGIVLNSCELYDPDSGTWFATGSMSTPRMFHTTTLLSSGKVLVAGGIFTGNNDSLPSAELYDPITGIWSLTNSMNSDRYGHTATLLLNDKVLVTNGVHHNSDGSGNYLLSCELYDPYSGIWSSTGSTITAFDRRTSTLLTNGKVLVIGGNPNNNQISELYDPNTGSWSATGDMTTFRFCHTATLLPNGKVLVAGDGTVGNGGIEDVQPNWGELYDPSSDTWSEVGCMSVARALPTATLLLNGKVLIAGGEKRFTSLSSAELYTPAPISEPTMSSIFPSSGPIAGGTSVTITGIGFSGGAAITIGGNEATNVVIIDDKTLTADTPFGTIGAQDVVVTTSGGTATLTGGFTYVPPPTISSFTPSSGRTGDLVTITGTNFNGATAVRFNGTTASAGTITWEQALLPENRNKQATVIGKVIEVVPGWTTHMLIVMGAPYGTGLEAEIFDPTIWPDPTFQSWIGKTIEVTGRVVISDKASSLGMKRLYILETSQVVVSPSTDASSFSVDSDTQITATVGSGATGQISVTTSGGTATSTDIFTYYGVPTLTGVSPSSGSTAGGTSVTITGTGFVNDNTTVTIGGATATNIVVVDSTITATTPAGTAGSQDVVVMTAGGSARLMGGFTYTINGMVTFPDPNLEAAIRRVINKPTGDISQSDLLTITKLSAPQISNLSGIEGCTNLTEINFNNGSISDISPLGSLSNLNRISLQNNQIESIEPLANITNLQSLCITDNQISDLSPLSGLTRLKHLALWGNQIGNLSPLINLTQLEGLEISSNPINDLSPLASLTHLQHLDLSHILTNDLAALSNLVNIKTMSLNYNNIRDISIIEGLSCLEYISLYGNQISDLSPLSNLTNLKTLELGVNQINDISVLSNLTELTFLSLCQNPIDSISPISSLKKLRFSNLNYIPISDTSVLEGLTEIETLFLNDDQITSIVTLVANTGLGTGDYIDITNNYIDLRPGMPERINIQTLIDRGVSVNYEPQKPAPTIASVSPSTGPIDGGTPVTITGTGFVTDNTTATIGGIAVTNVVVDNTTITADTPAGTVGARDVVVTMSGFTATLIGGFTYVALPTISTISPSSGPTAGGTAVTITGTNFISDNTTVTICGAVATNVLVIDDTTITATTPVGTVGEQDVEVTTPGGSATLTGGFTYVLGSITLSSGWNLLSTPYTLDSNKNRLSQIFDQESLSNINIIYGWSQGHWTQISSDFELEPLTAIYVEVKADKTASGTLVPSSEISSPPSRQLEAGLNLVGPAPAFQNGVLQTQTISEALVSIAQTEGGLPGYSMVVSPAHNQTGWSYAIGSQNYSLLPYKGYWVIMENPDTLYGFSTTPIVSALPITPPAGSTITWEEALLPENLKKTKTVTGPVVAAVQDWGTHIKVYLGAPKPDGFVVEVFDPNTFPDPTLQSWIGKTMVVTGRIQIDDHNPEEGYVMSVSDASQINLVQ